MAANASAKPSAMTTSTFESQAASTAQSRALIPCVEPATRKKLGEVAVVTPAQVRERVARARKAQAEWARTSFAERKKVLGHILDHVLAHADELCEMIVRDAGKTRENAMLGEIWPVCEKIRATVQNGEAHLAPGAPVDAYCGKSQITTKISHCVQVGACSCIVPLTR